MLPSVSAQIDRLVALDATGPLTPDELRTAAATLPDRPGLVVVAGARPSALAPLLQRSDRPGFVVEDMTDVDDFGPTVELPDAPVYLAEGLDRGDHLLNRSPAEALTELSGSPLTLTEGVLWVLQDPEVLVRNLCFMTIGSRLRKPRGGFDARTPAIWISNGTGRDGKAHKEAPKVGWCWWNNRHTWLGFASARTRTSAATVAAGGASN
ncbi:DUF5701 family protein [Pseudonocardia oroxyli]|uniref:Uncharacterized protein n=1 Tax=Pseudonocardia oroxyli TaxID=366584 RepID=A0A1G7JR10_PSEOR|nr:DUF5701 family protein [Pseudonocardia oroxyli]SDF27301.1 hypothetical protein SAMN05216377_104132 [Pseudonocardia oroxyli]